MGHDTTNEAVCAPVQPGSSFWVAHHFTLQLPGLDGPRSAMDDAVGLQGKEFEHLCPRLLAVTLSTLKS